MDQEVSVNELASLFINGHAKIFKQSWPQDVKYIDRYIRPIFGNRIASSIKRGEIELWHKNFNGTFLANRVLALICSIFNKGIEWELIENNPAKRIKKFPEPQRELFIPREELPTFFTELRKSPHYFKMTLSFMLLTGVRKKECLTLKWEDIAGTIIQVKKRKNKKDLFIPITEPIQIILSSIDKDGEYIFTNSGLEQRDYRRQWDNLRDRLKHKNFLNRKQLKFNDIRRTVGSYLGQNGANAKLIGEILGQTSIQSTQRYIRFQLEHVKTEIDKLPTINYLG
jgi:integrase